MVSTVHISFSNLDMYIRRVVRTFKKLMEAAFFTSKHHAVTEKPTEMHM